MSNMPILQFRSPEDEEALKSMASEAMIENRLAMRARMILWRVQGKSQTEIGQWLDIERDTVRRWEERYREKGIDGLFDEEGRGRKPSFSP